MFQFLDKAIFRLQFEKSFCNTINTVFKIRDLVYIRI